MLRVCRQHVYIDSITLPMKIYKLAEFRVYSFENTELYLKKTQAKQKMTHSPSDRGRQRDAAPREGTRERVRSPPRKGARRARWAARTAAGAWRARRRADSRTVDRATAASRSDSRSTPSRRPTRCPFSSAPRGCPRATRPLCRFKHIL